MTKIDLASLEGLRAACLRIENTKRSTDEAQRWTKELQNFLAWVAAADESTRATLAFQERLWDQNPVSNTGQGNITVAAALQDEAFRRWLAHESVASLPANTQERSGALTALYENLVERLKAYPIARTPRLKIFRVLAAFFPSDFTTVAHGHKLRQLYSRMGGSTTPNPVLWHLFVRGRIAEALGADDLQGGNSAWRMELPWYLYEAIDSETPPDERVTTPGPIAGDEKLVPLPAARRRRGMTSVKGYFTTLLTILEFVKEGVSREELLDYLRAANPDHKESTLRVIVNILRGELAVIRQDGDRYRLTPQGEAVLETGDPSELGPWLMTRILGVDHILKALENGPETRVELITLLQKVCSGWTSTFVPNALLNWLQSFKAIEQSSEGILALTPAGIEWAAGIHWTPEFLAEDFETIPSVLPSASHDADNGPTLPALANIVSSMAAADGYPKGTVERLHLGLWSPSIRHFAVLTGISGSGKTRLAKQYAEALTGTSADIPSSRVHVEAVQPAWYDPAPLLGYVSPLKEASYTPTAFLTFLLRASSDPARPYVAILDEMNLSHPEQYFAPILSAMETGSHLRFHAEGDSFDGIPRSIPYPRNLAVIGTINMDETTHGLSDKVLDRAFILEFSSVDMMGYPGWGSRSLEDVTRVRITDLLTDLLRDLTPARLHFGWRVVDDIVDFVAAGERESGADTVTEWLDAAVYAKILPKLRGEDNDAFRKALADVQKTLEKQGLTKSRSRVAELANDLRLSGSARFWR